MQRRLVKDNYLKLVGSFMHSKKYYSIDVYHL